MKTEVTFPELPMNRREVMIRGFAGAIALAGYGSRAGMVLANVPGVTHGESPGLTEGPYWVDGQPLRSDVRLDTSTSTYAIGTPIYLGLTISKLTDTSPYTLSPLVGAKVDIWSANCQGVYSDETVESTLGKNYGRGYQVSNSHGIVNFLTIYPGWYSGRTPHVHIRIRLYNAANVQTYNYTTQLFFDDVATTAIFKNNPAYIRATARDTYNTTDSIFTGSGANGSPATEAGDYMLTKIANDNTYVMGSFHIVIDPSDTANADATNGSSTGGVPTGGGGGGGGTPPAPPSAILAPKTTTRSAVRRRGR